MASRMVLSVVNASIVILSIHGKMMMTDSMKDNQPSLEDLISLSQASEISGLSHSHLRLLVRRGDIWGKRMGRDWFTSAEAVKDYIASNPKPGPKPKNN
jgi:hypothetical protein